MHRIVIKLSGSMFRIPMDLDAIKDLCSAFSSLVDVDIQPIIVAGGGAVARIYIDTLRALKSDETTLDELGILASRLNARIIIAGLGSIAYPIIPSTMEEVSLALTSGKIVVLGGLYPGHSTNATAALVAEKACADLFINATDVDGVYSEDPKINKRAKRFGKIDTKTLFDLVNKSPMAAGTYDLMDPLSIKIIERSRIKARIIFCSPKNITDAAKGLPIGTEVVVNT
ncbi:MAG: UMP kinase [Nitrososphaeria archaeon]